MSYEIILGAHIAAFMFNIGLVVLADGIGLLWVIGKLKKLPKQFMLVAHRAIWVGLAVSIVTGAYMFWDLRDYLLETPAFYTKVFFVLALVINSFLISKHLHAALGAESFAALEKKEKISFFISGAVSTISWIAVVVSAKLSGL